jgi:hypothetical protein
MRHPDHRFEWDRAQFRRWCKRAAKAAQYSVKYQDVAGYHPELGGASQLACFFLDDVGACGLKSAACAALS